MRPYPSRCPSIDTILPELSAGETTHRLCLVKQGWVWNAVRELRKKTLRALWDKSHGFCVDTEYMSEFEGLMSQCRRACALLCIPSRHPDALLYNNKYHPAPQLYIPNTRHILLLLYTQLAHHLTHPLSICKAPPCAPLHIYRDPTHACLHSSIHKHHSMPDQTLNSPPLSTYQILWPCASPYNSAAVCTLFLSPHTSPCKCLPAYQPHSTRISTYRNRSPYSPQQLVTCLSVHMCQT